jgi:hypothetical protein
MFVNKAITIFIGIIKNLLETQLHFTAFVLTVVADNRKGLVQEMQVRGRQVD